MAWVLSRAIAILRKVARVQQRLKALALALRAAPAQRLNRSRLELPDAVAVIMHHGRFFDQVHGQKTLRHSFGDAGFGFNNDNGMGIPSLLVARRAGNGSGGGTLTRQKR